MLVNSSGEGPPGLLAGTPLVREAPLTIWGNLERSNSQLATRFVRLRNLGSSMVIDSDEEKEETYILQSSKAL